MKRPGGRAITAGAIGLCALFLAAPWLGERELALPVIVSVEILAEEIHRGTHRGMRMPVEVALPRIARAGLVPFIHRLPLDDEVRSRILARLASTGFVDDLVPFLLSVKSMYLAPEDARHDDFDTALRATLRPEEDLPGIEHSMFRWDNTDQEPSDDDSSFGLDRAMIAELLSFYDAIYLVDRDPDADLAGRLACDPAEIEARVAASAGRGEAPLRRLLERVRDRMDPDSEMAAAVDGVLSDPERLETIEVTIVQFIEQTVCKHHRMLTSKLDRERETKRFLLGELEQPGGGRLWSYLQQARVGRRHAALIVVDGLQGHLVEALASGDARNPFVQELLREVQAGASRLGDTDEGSKLQQQTAFLEALAKTGFEHPSYLPFFRDLYTDSGSADALTPRAVARSGISTTPTISVRNLPVVMTGAPVAGPGSTGIPNFHFVDRRFIGAGRADAPQGRAYYFFGNDALQLSALTQRAGMKTLFERLAAHSSYSCASQYDEWAQTGIDPFFNLAIGEASRDFAEILCFSELERRAANEVRLRKEHESLLEMRNNLARPIPVYDWYRAWGRRTHLVRARQIIDRIAALEADSFPELLVYYNPWPDHFAHFKGPFSDEILSPSGELARLDHWLSRLMVLYRQAGVFERTLFGMAGDHGLSPVFQLESPQALVLDRLEARGIPLRIIKISSDEGEGPKLTSALKPPSMRGYDVVIASTAGGNLMLDLFIDQADRWHTQPLEADIRVWRPIAWQTDGDTRSLDLIAELLDGLGDNLDYLVVRSEPCDYKGGAIRLIGPRGEAVITRRGKRIHYDAIRGDILETERLSPYEHFDLAAQKLHRDLLKQCRQDVTFDEPASWCSEAEWRRLLRHTPRPDSVVQLAHLYDLEHAGTLNLFPAAGVAYNSIVPGRHAGESFHEKDAFAGLWGVPVEHTGERLESALGGSIPTAIYEYLQGKPVTPGESGWGYPSLWKEFLDST